MSSSFRNESSIAPSARNFSRSQGKRSPARGAPAGRAVEGLRQGALAVVDADLGDDAKGDPLQPSAAQREGRDPGEHLRAEQAGEAAVGDDQPERPVGGVQQAARDRDALVRVGIEQGRRGPALDDERQLPGQVVGVLQAGVHALRADRAVDVGGVAEQEAAAVAEARGAAVMDAVGGEPAAGLERQAGAGFGAQGGNHGLERDVVAAAQGRGQDADDAPVIFARAWGRADGSLPATGRR